MDYKDPILLAKSNTKITDFVVTQKLGKNFLHAKTKHSLFLILTFINFIQLL